MAVAQRYVLSKVIARGGMAEIYLGKHIGDDGFQRIVAIKRILPHYAREDEYSTMFRDEAHICQALQHPNIVRVEGFEVVENSYAIIMEYVDGSDLRSLLAAVEKSREVARIPVPMILYIIAEAARGLHYAHERKDEVNQRPLEIVHRDISPQNILLSYAGEVKVTDFGIADAEGAFKKTETKAGIVKGKYSYMSPEQITAKHIDRRTDIFALSVVLWESLAMKRLFQGSTEVETIEMVRNCRIGHRLTDLNSDVEPDLEKIVLKGLQKDVQKRYQTAEEFEKDIRKYLTKKYPDFTVNDLSSFVQSILDSKRKALAEEIKRTLESSPFNPSANETASNSQTHGSAVRIFEASSESNSLSALTLSKRNHSQGLVNHAGWPSHHSQGRTPKRQAQSGLYYNASKEHLKWKNLAIIALAALSLFMIATALFLNRQTIFSSKPLPRILLKTDPPNVVLRINDVAAFRGQYRSTPIQIETPEGRVKIQVSRQGYQDVTRYFDVKRGMHVQLDTIELKPSIAFAPTRVVLQGAYDQNVRIVVNDGFASAHLNKNSRFAIGFNDLGRDLTHQIVVFETESNKPIIGCSFTPTAQFADRPSIVAIDLARRRCEIRNPKSE